MIFQYVNDTQLCVHINLYIYLYVYRNQSVLFSLLLTLQECSDNTKKMSTYCTMGKEGGYRETFLFIDNLHTKSGQNGQSGQIMLVADFHVGSQNLTQTKVTAQQSLNNNLFLCQVGNPDFCCFFMKAESS